MANEQNLRPVRTKEEARERGRRGGLVKSPRKRIANQINALKRKGLDKEGADKLYKIMTSPELSALDIRTYLQGIKAHCKTATQMVMLSDSILRWHKLHHGEKIHVKSENININVTASEIINRISDFEKEESEEEAIDV